MKNKNSLKFKMIKSKFLRTLGKAREDGVDNEIKPNKKLFSFTSLAAWVALILTGMQIAVSLYHYKKENELKLDIFSSPIYRLYNAPFFQISSESNGIVGVWFIIELNNSSNYDVVIKDLIIEGNNRGYFSSMITERAYNEETPVKLPFKITKNDLHQMYIRVGLTMPSDLSELVSSYCRSGNISIGRLSEIALLKYGEDIFGNKVLNNSEIPYDVYKKQYNNDLLIHFITGQGETITKKLSWYHYDMPEFNSRESRFIEDFPSHFSGNSRECINETEELIMTNQEAANYGNEFDINFQDSHVIHVSPVWFIGLVSELTKEHMAFIIAISKKKDIAFISNPSLINDLIEYGILESSKNLNEKSYFLTKMGIEFLGVFNYVTNSDIKKQITDICKC